VPKSDVDDGKPFIYTIFNQINVVKIKAIYKLACK